MNQTYAFYVLPIGREEIPSFPQDCALTQSFTAMWHALFLSSVTMRRSTYTYTWAPIPILQKPIISFRIFRSLLQSFTIFHNIHYFEIRHVIPCVRQSPQIFFLQKGNNWITPRRITQAPILILIQLPILPLSPLLPLFYPSVF